MSIKLAAPGTFGARVRAERERRKWSGARLARFAGVSGSNIVTRIERGECEPGLFRAARIAYALGISLDSLLVPPECDACDDMPQAGFTCGECKTTGRFQ